MRRVDWADFKGFGSLRREHAHADFDAAILRGVGVRDGVVHIERDVEVLIAAEYMGDIRHDLLIFGDQRIGRFLLAGKLFGYAYGGLQPFALTAPNDGAEFQPGSVGAEIGYDKTSLESAHFARDILTNHKLHVVLAGFESETSIVLEVLSRGKRVALIHFDLDVIPHIADNGVLFVLNLTGEIELSDARAAFGG